MAKKMCSLACKAPDANALERGLGDLRDRVIGAKAYTGSTSAQKQPATRTLGSAITQVSDDSCADVWRNRQPGALPALGANAHLAGSPIDIIQTEGCDLVGPQAEFGQHHENGVVPPSGSTCSIASIENILHLFGRQIAWQARKLPFSDRRNAARQMGQV